MNTYDVNGDGLFQRDEMKELMMNALTVGWIPK